MAAGTSVEPEIIYVSDEDPGIGRERSKSGFKYVDMAGKVITDKDTLARINALAIPPAYENVWICSLPNGHLQATGRDARGRKQYRYHDEWARTRDADKFEQLQAFGMALPSIRRRVEKDLGAPALSQAKIVASVVRLLDVTLIRIGSQAYARSNKSYGLTTLKQRHVAVTADRIRFRFKGKSGVEHDVTVTDARVARIVKRCMEIPGHQLFHYKDNEGVLHPVDSNMVNAYLKEASRQDFTAKHYRTWAGSVEALAALQRLPASTEPEARRNVAVVIKAVARHLRNTPAVCRKCYVHPAIIDSYLQGRLPACDSKPSGPRALRADERRLLAFLQLDGARHDTCMKGG